jgi:hypothetical protein
MYYKNIFMEFEYSTIIRMYHICLISDIKILRGNNFT